MHHSNSVEHKRKGMANTHWWKEEFLLVLLMIVVACGILGAAAAVTATVNCFRNSARTVAATTSVNPATGHVVTAPNKDCVVALVVPAYAELPVHVRKV